MDLEDELLRQVDGVARDTGRSRNQVVADSLEQAVRSHERSRIDRAFEGIVDDLDYQDELLRLEREMSRGSEEAWGLLDRVAERRQGGESSTG
ncbi:MAG: hypothetical protein HY319_01085 [Armatimonadetes bacterium]|nr:hypothetical protein [Armatimonadota bacterium]